MDDGRATGGRIPAVDGDRQYAGFCAASRRVQANRWQRRFEKGTQDARLRPLQHGGIRLQRSCAEKGKRENKSCHALPL
jgi:hypothetical protein